MHTITELEHNPTHVLVGSKESYGNDMRNGIVLLTLCAYNPLGLLGCMWCC